MRILIFSLFLFFSQPALPTSITVVDKNEPSLVVQGENINIQLPKEASAALKKWNSEFNVFDRKDFSPSVIQLFDEDKAQPMVFLGNLDGSGRTGIVLFGEDKKSQFVVALIPQNSSWIVVEVHTTSMKKIKETEVPSLTGQPESGVPYYILSAIGDHAKKLGKKTGIQVETYLGSGEVFEIKDGKVLPVVL